MTDRAVELEQIRQAVDAVGAIGLETVLVGANALVVLGLPAATYDVDFAVRRRDFEAARTRLDELGWRTDVVGNSIAARRQGLEVEIVHPGPFGPPDDPDVFFEYLRTEGSTLTELGRAARVEIVWYMRLGFEPETGRQKILQDVLLKLADDPEEVLRRVAALAGRMQRLATVAPHLAWIRDELRRRATY